MHWDARDLSKFTAALSVLALVSCDASSDKGLLGQWRVGSDDTVTLYPDHTFSHQVGRQQLHGSWRLEQRTLHLYGAPDSQTASETFSVAMHGDRVILESPEGGGGTLQRIK